MIKHSKKRNTGLINEFFARYIGRAIIEQNDKKIHLSKEILKKYFNKGTDLYKELKLFNSLYKTRVNNKESAYSIINNIKEVCKLQSQERLELEKTALLKEINEKLNGSNFFNESIKDYKIFGSIQILLNFWRSNNHLSLNESINEIVQMEEKLVEHLIKKTEEKSFNESFLKMTNHDINDFVVNIMHEKLHDKFGSLLNEEQKKIINYYIYFREDENIRNNFCNLLENIKERTLTKIDNEFKKSESEFFSKKLNEVKKVLLEEEVNKDLEQMDDSKISFYLAVLNLEKELNDETT